MQKIFYKKYGNINFSVILEQPAYNGDFYLDFHCDIEFSYGIKQKRYWQESTIELSKEIEDFAKQSVCPIAKIGYYYPPLVFIGENALLYCLYEYQEEIEIFKTPQEIIYPQILGSNIPIGIEFNN